MLCAIPAIFIFRHPNGSPRMHCWRAGSDVLRWCGFVNGTDEHDKSPGGFSFTMSLSHLAHSLEDLACHYTFHQDLPPANPFAGFPSRSRCRLIPSGIPVVSVAVALSSYRAETCPTTTLSPRKATTPPWSGSRLLYWDDFHRWSVDWNVDKMVSREQGSLAMGTILDRGRQHPMESATAAGLLGLTGHSQRRGLESTIEEVEEVSSSEQRGSGRPPVRRAAHRYARRWVTCGRLELP